MKPYTTIISITTYIIKILISESCTCPYALNSNPRYDSPHSKLLPLKEFDLNRRPLKIVVDVEA